MFVGFYCARSAGQFSAAVALIIVICDGLKTFASGPVVVSSSIILQLGVFMAGATNVSGAGFFAFGGMIFITAYIVLGVRDAELIFTDWSYVLVFWIVVPTVNMFFDAIRWTTVKKTLESRFVTSTYYLLIDIMMMVAALAALTVLGTNAIRLYDHIAILKGFRAPIPIDQYLHAASENFSRNGVWFAIMLFGTLVPTLINVGIFVSAGIMRLVPPGIRNHYAAECEREHLTLLAKDRLAWKISAIDSLTGIIFFGATFVSLAYLLAWLAPAIGAILYSLAEIRLA